VLLRLRSRLVSVERLGEHTTLSTFLNGDKSIYLKFLNLE
jgi:hypothetical protein